MACLGVFEKFTLFAITIVTTVALLQKCPVNERNIYRHANYPSFTKTRSVLRYYRYLFI